MACCVFKRVGRVDPKSKEMGIWKLFLRIVSILFVFLPSLVWAQQRQILALAPSLDENVKVIWSSFKEGLRAGGLSEGKGLLLSLKSSSDFKGDEKLLLLTQ
jgi:hypothetical protein